MPYTDPEKRKAAQRERSRRCRAKQHAAKFGEGAGNMSGKHGNHARGSKHARWNSTRLITSHGYVLVRVPPDHPRAFGPPRLKHFKYAYEHDIIMEKALGRSLKEGEVVHHLNGKRDDNRSENLALRTVSDHAREHVSTPGARGRDGKFTKGKRH